MIASFDTLLLLGATGFYLYDSMELLHVNEFVLLHKKGKWSYVYPNSNFLLLGKSPFIPNPLRPDIDIYVVAWSELSQSARQPLKHVRRFQARLSLLRYGSIMLLAILLLALPCVLLIYGSGTHLSALFAVTYVLVALLIGTVSLRSSEFQLSGARLFGVCFHCMACPPFAINLLRKITSRSGLIIDPVKFSKMNLSHNDFEQLVSEICYRIDDQLGRLDENARHYKVLDLYRIRILGMIK